MNKIYVAGPYSGDTLQTLTNMRNGMRKATELLVKGYAPFCPWVDYHYTLMLRDGESISYQKYLDYSITWMECSDAVLLLPGWENSKGTLREIEVAEKIGIPVFYPDQEDKMDMFFEFAGIKTPIVDLLKAENEKAENE